MKTLAGNCSAQTAESLSGLLAPSQNRNTLTEMVRWATTFVVVWISMLSQMASSAEVQKSRIRFTEPAFSGMPIWVEIASSNPYKVSYPYSTSAWDIGLNKLEVRQNGQPIQPKKYPPGPPFNGIVGGSIAPATSPGSRLPLHILYPLKPGSYEVRYTRFDFRLTNGGGENYVVEQSEWTKLNVLPYPEEKRQAWVDRRLSALPADAGLLIGDAIPELLAVPNAKVLRTLLEILCNRQGIASSFARDTVTMFPESELNTVLMEATRLYGPSEEAAYLVSWRRKGLYSHTAQIVESTLPFLKSSDPSKVSGSIKTLEFIRSPEAGFPLAEELKLRMDNSVLAVSSVILDTKKELAYSNLTQYLAMAKPAPKAREILWRMVDQKAAYEQSLICIAWMANARDLPRLTAELLKDEPADLNGRERSSLPYQFQTQYGPQSYPYLVDVFVKSNARFIRESAEKELVRDDPAVFRALEKILVGDDPAAKKKIRGFVRAHFSPLQSADDEAVLKFVRLKAK
jgi:hypothetical protein